MCDDTEGPDIDWLAVLERHSRLLVLVPDKFRRHKLWGPERKAFGLRMHFDRKAEVRNLDVIEIFAHQYVFRFQVSVDDTLLVQAVHCVENLREDLLGRNQYV